MKYTKALIDERLKGDFMTQKEACQQWVQRDMSAIPQSLIQRAYCEDSYYTDDISEITPPSVNDRVYCFNSGEEGFITKTIKSEDDDEIKYEIQLDNGEEIILSQTELEVNHDDYLPMWGTMWMFDDPCDNHWLEEQENLQKMADCGFRMYEIDEGIVFGIDGAGYDFYEGHWMPLYKERGLHWHD